MDITDYDNSLIYMAPPVDPEPFNKRLKEVTGENPHTNGAYLRFVWGMDRTEFIDGHWLRRYPDPDGKYVGLPRWVLEGWQSPAVFDRAQWEANADIMGPFPYNGEWDFIAVVETKDKKFMNLTNDGATKLAQDWRFWKSKPNKRACEDILRQRAKNLVLREKRWEAKKEEIYADMTERVINAIERPNDTAYSLPTEKETGAFKRTRSGLLVPNN